MTSKFISIRGAREHNLKNISLDLPREQLVVITGLSGSGKSSLAFDTIYAEGQRRYVESLSAYARQFLDMMQKPDVDHIEGLSPAISIEQKTTSRNPRSTVGTVTEIYDYMRLLWARVGIPYSPATGLPIESQTVSQMVDRVLALPEGTRLYLLAPIARGRKGEYRKEFAELQKKGFQRLKIDGRFYEIAEAPTLDKKYKHDIDVVVDRIVVRPDIAARLADQFETALGLTDDGIAIAEFADETAKRVIFSAKFACPESGFTIEEIEPRLFSFNNPYGACPECDGLGTELFFEPELVVPDENLSLARGAIAPWARTSASSPYYQQTLESLARAYRQPMTKPWKSLPEDFRKVVLYGSGEDEINFTYDDGVRHYSTTKPFEGVINNIERRWRETDSAWVTEELSRYQSEQFCEVCKGYRLKPQALAVKIAGLHIGQVTEMSIREAAAWFEALPGILTPKQNEIAAAHPEGDPRAAQLPQRCRARLPHAVARLRLALRRREPAHPPRLADRLGPHRRALRAGRALDRPASARQCAAARNAEGAARHGQLRAGGRARRGGDPRAPTMSSTWARAPACMAARWWPRARPNR